SYLLRVASLASKLRTLRNTLEVLGPVTTARATLAELLAPVYETDDRFDRRFGTETTKIVSVRDGQVPQVLREDAANYWPVPESVGHHLLQRLPIRHNDFVFIDAGCGKGRALLLASMFPFARIVGVEISPVTAEIARKNLGIFDARAAKLQ